ncbi:VPS13D [Cordylochernes scorpioides]|uniref:VPS13D n=1 Tax=Cordylochernes scorpioides TaxID=51811 RepID=A0ABY6K8S1_9ARAC|nr:VPS13D [Cordylochernes scorpioides]
MLVKREGFPPDKSRKSSGYITSQPGHHLYLFAPLELTNLLPCDLYFQVKDWDVSGVIKPGKSVPLHTVDPHSPVSIKFRLDGFPHAREVTVHPGSKDSLTYLELWDTRDRLLYLQVRLILLHNHSVKASVQLHVSAPYWLVNKTGLPLVFRQHSGNLSNEAAGQSSEHEMARSVAPLLFSFIDPENKDTAWLKANRTRKTKDYLHNVQRLEPANEKQQQRDFIGSYIIGLEVRRGRGRYQDTHILTFAPRYQINNRTSFKLEISQKINGMTPDKMCVLQAMPSSTIPFHWPRFEQENLLCVRLPEVKDCCWSGGFKIRISSDAFHINMRDTKGKCHFLRVEVVFQAPSFLVIFKDTDNMPPPLRIDNYSEVPVLYYQSHVTEERLKTYIRPHHSVPYAWDEPNLQPFITVCAPGGTAGTYNFNSYGEGEQLYYENFIYITFTGTFLSVQNTISTTEDNITGQQLVLDVPHGTSVILNKKEPGSRTQLWRLSSTQQLYHEGSGPPRDPQGKHHNQDHGLVLDVGIFNGECAPLVLRRPDERRSETQTWTFTSDGRLCCKLPQCYVQARDGYLGLCPGKEVVLGRTVPITLMTLESGIPIEQAVSYQKLRGGSGVLAVRVLPDGPTRVLNISDIRHKKAVSQSPSQNLGSDWVLVEDHPAQCANAPEAATPHQMDIQVNMHLLKGLGVSVVNRGREELIYALLENIQVECILTSTSLVLDATVSNLQVDNQLRQAERPVVLYTTQSARTSSTPALHLTLDKMILPYYRNASIFKHLILTSKNLTLHLEEYLLLHLLEFTGYSQAEVELEKLDEDESQVHRTSTQNFHEPKHYYFNTFKLGLYQVRFSLLTAINLPPRLANIKYRAGLRMVRFEDVLIELDPFVRVHPFETLQYLCQNIQDHYAEELKSQSAKILGSVDILGNPIGLMNDFTNGISTFINDGSVGGLIKNVAHGLSDSAAKVTGSLSDGIGLVTMDERHQEMRKKIRQDSQGADHLVAGLKGLGFGLLGGMTSIVTNTYEGASSDGVPGFLSGLGRGLVGTVAKPAAGLLDLASGAASAVRDTSKRRSHYIPQRKRRPRMCVGEGGFLPPFCQDQAHGQDLLYILNQHNFSELFISFDQLRTGPEDLQALVSTEQVYILSRGNNVVLSVNLSELDHCEVLVTQDKVYLKVFYRQPSSDCQPCKKPQVRADSEDIANKVSLYLIEGTSLQSVMLPEYIGGF